MQSSKVPPAADSQHSVARSASVVGLAVLSSRVLGLVREQVFAAFFGAGRVFDAFVTAFRIPNLFRDLFAEGALSAAFVKTFSQKLDREGEEKAWRLAALVFVVLGLAVAAVVLLGMLFAPALVGAMAPGFDAEKRELTVALARLMFPFLLMVALAAVAMGVLNAKNVFGVPAMASTFFNVGSIVTGLAASWLLEPGFMSDVARAIATGGDIPRDTEAAARAIFGMGIGVLAGGCLQLFVQAPALRRVGFRPSARVDLRDPGLREVLRLMGPAVLGTAATQINVFVNTWFASGLGDGAMSWLNYAFRLMQFPIGVFGVAIATATLPAISRAAARQDTGAYRDVLASSLQFALFLTVPSAVGLAVLGRPIIGLIYERGSFGAADTLATADALSFYALGLVGYSLIKILAPAFYAIDDPKVPARVSLASIAVNVGLSALLVGPLGHRGLALSTSVVATANALLLLALLRHKVGPLHGGRMVRALAKIAAASAVLGAAAWGARAGLEQLLPSDPLPARMAVVFGAIAAGAAAFAITCAALKVEEMGRVAEIVRRRKG